MAMATINDVPEVILEYILSQVSPYNDLKSCMLVNRLWYTASKQAITVIKRQFHLAIEQQRINWQKLSPPVNTRPNGTIQRRHSHSCALVDNRMYIFGGCTTNTSTTYNDLWCFHLSKRTWVRPLSVGTYPPPKACASMITYKDKLILYGGWAHTSPYYPLHNSWRIFDHIHIYDTEKNSWNGYNRMGPGNCPATAGHSATLFRGDKMLLFGGLQALDDGRGPPYNMSNDVWILDISTLHWTKQKMTGRKPKPRYGHSQVNIDDNHILIIGGCSGPDEMLYDIWLLEVVPEPPDTSVPQTTTSGPSSSSSQTWGRPSSSSSVQQDNHFICTWWNVDIYNQKDAAPRLSFHPACKVGDKVVILGRCKHQKIKPPLKRQMSTSESATYNSMCAYVLDISELISEKKVRWISTSVHTQEPGRFAPENLVLYTLVEGKGELLMFGGIKRESSTFVASPNQVGGPSETASNSLYSLSYVTNVI